MSLFHRFHCHSKHDCKQSGIHHFTCLFGHEVSIETFFGHTQYGCFLCLQNSDEEEEEQKDEDDEKKDEECERAEVSVSVKDLINLPKQNLHMLKQTRLEGITGTPDERCKDGLQCLRKVGNVVPSNTLN